jgi:hypothetical protein
VPSSYVPDISLDVIDVLGGTTSPEALLAVLSFGASGIVTSERMVPVLLDDGGRGCRRRRIS